MNKTVLIILGVIAVVALAFAGLLPLPGQKDNVTVLNQPGPSAPPETPKGPAHKPEIPAPVK